MRGIAALWVVLYHYASQYLPAIHADRYTHLLDKGYLAVDLFFMLSGFVLTHVYWRAFTEPVRGSYWKFLLARIARLYPLHLFVLSLFLATALTSEAVQYATTGTFAAIAIEGARSVTALMANLLMLQGLKASELSWNYPAWSISVEFIAYLGFPFALPWIWRARASSKIALAFVLVAALGWLAYLTHDDFDQWDGLLTLLRCIPEFLIGTLLYAAFSARSWTVLAIKDWIPIAIVSVLLLLLHLGIADLAVILLFPFAILTAVANKGRVSKVLNAAPLVWLGEISYSLYLFHGLVQFVTTKLLAAAGLDSRDNLSVPASLTIMTVMLLASFLCATLAYDSIEKAGRQRLRLLFGT
jgi:peptidoglycan/LPS O-acetylase OafA/YrhL